MFLFSSTVKEGFFHYGCLEYGEMAKLLKLQFKIFKYSISSKQILTKHYERFLTFLEVWSMKWKL